MQHRPPYLHRSAVIACLTLAVVGCSSVKPRASNVYAPQASPSAAVPAARAAANAAMEAAMEAQTKNIPQNLIAGTGPAWRATSRLGYAPTAASAQAAQPNAAAWGLQQLEAAHAASQKSPNIPSELAGFNAPVDELAAEFHTFNEARKRLRERGPEAKDTEADKAIVEERFLRETVRTSAAWRVMACSSDAIEQPLLAKMTEFWFNHFNVSVSKGSTRPFIGNYATTLRAQALGKFEDLLLASARHPAMLLYLDQAQSNVRGLNENYARELMELHTLGVGGGYSQADVRELARILTGWTVPVAQGKGFAFNPRQHDTGDKVLLGTTFKNNGQQEGEDAIRMLARHPATARRVTLRLAQTFVSDKPSPALLAQLASTFTRTQGDIHAVMQAIITSPEFWKPENSLFKTPFDYACSVLTAQGGVKEQRDVQQTLGFLNQAGQPVHAWPTPDGYKTDAATWLAPEALTRRADYAINQGGRMTEPAYLQPFLSAANRARIAREAPAVRTGLLLASPDFMSK
jgi:uncharacterized protein (DUF1800 family)